MRIVLILTMFMLPIKLVGMTCDLIIPDEVLEAKDKYYLRVIELIHWDPHTALATNDSVQISSIVQGSPYRGIKMTPSEIEASSFSLEALCAQPILGYFFPVTINECITGSMFFRYDERKTHGAYANKDTAHLIIRKYHNEIPWLSDCDIFHIQVQKEETGQRYSDNFTVFRSGDNILVSFFGTATYKQLKSKSMSLYSLGEAKEILKLEFQ